MTKISWYQINVPYKEQDLKEQDLKELQKKFCSAKLMALGVILNPTPAGLRMSSSFQLNVSQVKSTQVH